MFQVTSVNAIFLLCCSNILCADISAAGAMSSTHLTLGPVITNIETSPEHCGMRDGVIIISAESDTGPLEYSIDGGPFTTDSVFSGLIAGNHHIAVQDTVSSIITTVLLDAVDAVQIQSVIPDNATCDMDNGRILVITPQVEINGYSLDKVNYQGGPMFSHLAPGTYTVYLKSHDVCLDSATVTVGRIDPPVIDSIFVNTPLCRGDSGMVSVFASGGTPPLLYAFGEYSMDTISRFSGIAPGAYVVTLTDAYGCIVNAPVEMPEGNGPTISIIHINPATCRNSDGSIRVIVPDPDLVMSLDDSLFSVDGNFTAISSGPHYLSVSDSICTIDTVIQVPSEDCRIFMPNVFSPNGDGINDVFGPVAPEGTITFLSFEIYDRWGSLLFSCLDQAQCPWDGYVDGEPVPPGVYVYHIVYTSDGDHLQEQAGDVTVLR